AGEAQPQEAGDLVERLAGGVVERSAQHGEVQGFSAVEQGGVPAGDDQPHAGEDVAPGGQPAGVDGSGDVVDPDQRHAQGQGQRLAGRDADQQGADQPRGVVDGDAADVGQPEVGLAQGLVDDGEEARQVSAGGDLGNDPAEAGVQVGLR